MEFRRLLKLLRHHLGLILLAAALGLATGTMLAASIPREYIAHGAVWIDERGAAALSQQPVANGAGDENRFGSLREILASQRVALRVVDGLRLTEYKPGDLGAFFPEPRLHLPPLVAARVDQLRALVEPANGDAPARGDGAGRDLQRMRLADALLRRLTVTTPPKADVVGIAYSAGTPRVAAQVVNEFMQSFSDVALELTVDPARASSGWYEDQIAELQARTDAARTALFDYQQQNGIVSTDESLDVESLAMADLSSQVVAAQAQAHPAVQALKAELARANDRVASLPPQLGANHPTMRSAREEVASIQQRLDSQVNQLVGSLRGQLATQKAKLLDMKSRRAQAAGLAEQLQSSQRALEDAKTRAESVRLQAEVNRSNVAIVRNAVPPVAPADPGPFTWIAGGGLAGLVLGIGLALWREGSRRLVRDIDDLRMLVGAPMLGLTFASRSRVLALSGPDGPQRFLGHG